MAIADLLARRVSCLRLPAARLQDLAPQPLSPAPVPSPTGVMGRGRAQALRGRPAGCKRCFQLLLPLSVFLPQPWPRARPCCSLPLVPLALGQTVSADAPWTSGLLQQQDKAESAITSEKAWVVIG